MIEFTEAQIKDAAKTMKLILLGGMPGMDHVSVKLNCEPNHAELVYAHQWALAFGYATRSDIRPIDAAAAIYAGKRP